MAHPKAYDPIQGYMYQILCRERNALTREWEHCDYAESTEEKNYILKEYNLGYRGGFEFKVILLPRKYWRKSDECRAEN